MLAVGLSKAGQAMWLTGSTDVLALAAGSRVLLCHIPNLTASSGEEVTCSSDSPYIFSCPSEDSVTAISFAPDGESLAMGTSTGKARPCLNLSVLQHQYVRY